MGRIWPGINLGEVLERFRCFMYGEKISQFLFFSPGK